jgi:Uma2 family endonuclease
VTTARPHPVVQARSGGEPSVSASGSVSRRLLTRHEFELGGRTGVFGPEERLELIGGEIVRKVAPQRPLHATGTALVQNALNRGFCLGFDVRVQLPLALGLMHEPEPDVAVVPGSIRDYEREHPTGAVLVVEVSDSTLAFDRTVKASLYASAGIAEYWILNLPDRVLEVHREPAAMAEQPFGYHYRSVTRLIESDSIAPVGASQSALRVADLLPRAA